MRARRQDVTNVNNLAPSPPQAFIDPMCAKGQKFMTDLMVFVSFPIPGGILDLIGGRKQIKYIFSNFFA